VEGSGSLSLKNSTYADETGISTTGSGGQWNISPKFSMPSSRAGFLQNEDRFKENLANKIH
jgi:hypothetical protein